MPSQRYLRWHASPVEEEDEFPELGEELDTAITPDDEVSAGSGNSSNGRVMSVLPARRGRRFSSGRRPTLCCGGHNFSTKSILLLAVSCALCVTIGALIGYSMVPYRHQLPSHHQAESSSSSSHRYAPPFGGRDFRRVTAVRFQSHLTSHMINVYARRLNRIPRNQLPDHIASTLRIRGYTTKIVSFSATLSTPDSHKPNTVELEQEDGTYRTIGDSVLFNASLPFAVYSPAGEAVGAVVYAHGCSAEDLSALRNLGVTIRGAVLLVRHTTDSEAAQVARAESAGAAGVLLYPDPEQFRGNGTLYPHGTGLPHDGVLTPSVKLVPGDPSTVFYPSLNHVYKKPANKLKGLVPSIPVQPISYNTAKILLASLDGPDIPANWRHAKNHPDASSSRLTHQNSSKEQNSSITLNADHFRHKTHKDPTSNNPVIENGDNATRYDENVTENSTHSTDSVLPKKVGGLSLNGSAVVRVRLRVHNLLRERRISNVHAWLPSQDADKVVHIGASQSSTVGLASLLAVAESLVRTLPKGTGRRVLLSAWTDSQFGFIGSTEFTELYSSWLEESSIAYLDLGSSVGWRGGLRVQSSPLLHEVIREASHHVAWPQQEALSVMEGWRMEGGRTYDIAYEAPGCSSDAVSFTAARGIAVAQFTVARPIAPGKCREGDCHACYDTREEHPLSGSQYDTLDAVTRLLDPSLDWTTAMASLVGVSSLVLTESVLPPVDFKGDFSASLVDGWWSFLHQHLPALNHTSCNFTDIVDAIRNELYTVEEKMTELSSWYNRRPAYSDPYLLFRHDEDRVNSFVRISRRLLGPRGVSRVFSTALVGPSIMHEDPLHAPHSPEGSFMSPTEDISHLPSNIQAIQTSEVFAESLYNNLAFSSSYREQDKPRPHTWFPLVSQALARALLNESTWENLYEELSLLLAALTSFRNLIPLHG